MIPFHFCGQKDWGHSHAPRPWVQKSRGGPSAWLFPCYTPDPEHRSQQDLPLFLCSPGSVFHYRDGASRTLSKGMGTEKHQTNSNKCSLPWKVAFFFIFSILHSTPSDTFLHIRPVIPHESFFDYKLQKPTSNPAGINKPVHSCIWGAQGQRCFRLVGFKCSGISPPHSKLSSASFSVVFVLWQALQVVGKLTYMVLTAHHLRRGGTYIKS